MGSRLKVNVRRARPGYLKTAARKPLKVKIDRTGRPTLVRFSRYFRGFDKIDAVRSIFGASTSRILRDLKVCFFEQKAGYMGVSDVDGSLVVSSYNLRNGKFRDLYLDVIHELVHVQQFRQGREIFDNRYEYVDSPVEIEAYRHVVKEAERIGMSRAQIVDYLRVEWISERALTRLLRNIGFSSRPRKRKGQEPPP